MTDTALITPPPGDPTAQELSRQRAVARLKAFVTVIIWGASFVTTKIIVEQMDPLVLVPVRTSAGALLLFLLLQRTAETVMAHATAHLAAYHLTTSQFGVLEALYHLGTLSQRELARKLLKSTGNISIVLKNLEKRGLIARGRNPDDTRFMQVCISETGEQLLTSMLREHVRGIVEEMSILTAEEQQDLARLCRKLGLRS